MNRMVCARTQSASDWPRGTSRPAGRTSHFRGDHRFRAAAGGFPLPARVWPLARASSCQPTSGGGGRRLGPALGTASGTAIPSGLPAAMPRELVLRLAWAGVCVCADGPILSAAACPAAGRADQAFALDVAAGSSFIRNMSGEPPMCNQTADQPDDREHRSSRAGRL